MSDLTCSECGWTGNLALHPLPTCLARRLSAANERAEAATQGREALRQQTVRIRRAALGSDEKCPGVDTEEIVRDLRERAERAECERDEARAREERLREALRGIARRYHLTHSGSCCTFDDAGKVAVTRESCWCMPEERAVYDVLGLWDMTPDERRAALSASPDEETKP